jgi:hypothetical protein
MYDGSLGGNRYQRLEKLKINYSDPFDCDPFDCGPCLFMGQGWGSVERKARPKVYAGQSARRAWAMEVARLGNAGTGAVVAVFFATSVTGPERAGRNIIASRDVAISTTIDDQPSGRLLCGFVCKACERGPWVSCPMARAQKKSPDPGSGLSGQTKIKG